MAAKVWNSDKQNRLVKMYESGNYSVTEIADSLQVSWPTIYGRFHRLGWPTNQLPRRYKGPGKVAFTKRDDQLIAACKAEGMFATTIALRLGKPRTVVSRRIKELGLKNSNLLPLKTGERFASLVVLGPAEPKLNRRTGFRVAQSLVRCDCGKELLLPNHALRCGNTKTCGGFNHRLKLDTPWNRIMHQVKGAAKSRGVSMTLSKEQIKLLALLPCAYCKQMGSNRLQGRAAGRTNRTERARYNGIDQIVPCGGYDAGNVVPCCCICNRAKLDLSLGDFVIWLQSIGSEVTVKEILDHAKQLERQLKA